MALVKFTGFKDIDFHEHVHRGSSEHGKLGSACEYPFMWCEYMSLWLI